MVKITIDGERTTFIIKSSKYNEVIEQNERLFNIRYVNERKKRTENTHTFAYSHCNFKSILHILTTLNAHTL